LRGHCYTFDEYQSLEFVLSGRANHVDTIFLGIVIIFFAACAGMIKLFERL
jgi:hypothetical protein